MRAKIFKKAAGFLAKQDSPTSMSCWALAYALEPGIQQLRDSLAGYPEYSLWRAMHGTGEAVWFTRLNTSLSKDWGWDWYTHGPQLRKQLLLEAAINLKEQGYASDN